MSATCGDFYDFILKYVAKRINAVNADIDNWAAACNLDVMKPFARMVRATGKTKLRTGKNRCPDLSSLNSFANATHAVFKPEDVGYSESNVGFSRCFNHLSAFVSIHSQRFFAEHSFSRGNHC